MPVNGSLFEHKLAAYSAPTLMKCKCASLFNIVKSEINNYKECIDYFNHCLAPYDLHISILKNTKSRMLIYVYSPAHLKKLLENEKICRFLNMIGYHTDSIPQLLGQLKRRLNTEYFPHEIGVFLGYPLEDVLGFIENREAKCVGYWKVYGNETYARECFARYDECERIVKDMLQSGKHLEEGIPAYH